MAFNLTVSAITPPDGLPHTDRKTEIMELPTYLRVTGASGASELKLVFVSASEPGPDNIDNVWLKIDETGRKHGFYIYDAILGTWLLMAGPGVYVGTTAPTDINILWLKTNSTNAILTVGGTTAVAAPQGLYQCVGGTLWTCFTTTAAEAKQVIIQATAPTGATDTIWVKTASEKGVWYWTGSAWVNAAAPGTVSPGVGANYIQTSSTQPSSSVRNYVLWAKTGNPPNGLFYPDSTNSWWQSISPISISTLYPASGTVAINPGVITDPVLQNIAYTALCPTLGTAVFSAAPMITAMLSADDGYAYLLNWYITSRAESFDLALYNGTPGSRNIQFRMSAVGNMRIPFT